MTLIKFPLIKQRFESMGFNVILGKHIYAKVPLANWGGKISRIKPKY